MTWKRQVEEHIDQIGLKKEHAIDRTKWRGDVKEAFKKHKVIPRPALTETNRIQKMDLSFSLFLI